MDYITAIRKQKPLIHNITNIVVANFSANGLLAIGASPVMANAPEEVEEMVSHANALVLNIGTCTQTQVRAMLLAGKTANDQGIPVILDPVGVGATSFRKQAVKQILGEINVSVIRGNTGEIAILGEAGSEMKGVDASTDHINPNIAKQVSRRYGSIVITTGETDVITDGERYSLCKNGVPMLPRVTGSGCLLTAIIGAFVSVADDRYHASVNAVSSYGAASEIAMETVSGPGAFSAALMDSLYNLTNQDVTKRKRIQMFTAQED